MQGQICQWLVVAFESHSRDTREYLQVTYDDLHIHIQPHNDEYCNVMSVFVEPNGDIQQSRTKLNRFLSAMAWKDSEFFITRGGISSGARASDRDSPRFNYREKRRYPYGVISPFDFEHLVAPTEDRQRLALALYRDGLGADNEFYRFLSFYKVINVLFSHPTRQMEWINANVPHVQHHFGTERAAFLQARGDDIGRYLFVQGRSAIAHAFARPIRDPDLQADRAEILADCDLIKGLAAVLIENELGLPSLRKIWREHLYELSGFKELFGEELVGKLSRRERLPTSDFSSLPRLTVALKGLPPYECLTRLEFKVTSCDAGIIVLETDREVEAMVVRLTLDFPGESLELDLNNFEYTRIHWKYRIDAGLSYYRFLTDYFHNGCLQVFDALNSERLSHKLGFIPMNIDPVRTINGFALKSTILRSSTQNDAGVEGEEGKTATPPATYRRGNRF